MISILITLLTFVLILVSLFMVLVILMQRANQNAGLGSAFGGGVAESAFGADTSNVLSKATRWSATVFFVLSLALYLMHISARAPVRSGGEEDIDPLKGLQVESVDTAQPTGAPESGLEGVPMEGISFDGAATGEDDGATGVQEEAPADGEDSESSDEDPPATPQP